MLQNIKFRNSHGLLLLKLAISVPHSTRCQPCLHMLGDKRIARLCVHSQVSSNRRTPWVSNGSKYPC